MPNLWYQTRSRTGVVPPPVGIVDEIVLIARRHQPTGQVTGRPAWLRFVLGIVIQVVLNL